MTSSNLTQPISPDNPDNPDNSANTTAAQPSSHPTWLQEAVFYEIYPQSFYDSNGDGIGDLPGITAKLDYVKSLGCTAIWINPCFDSPFKDAGYDVRDYKLIAPRYGSNQDAFDLFEEAHRRGLHVLLDLVPGHTSEEHAWFQASSREDPAQRGNDDFGPLSDRYIWTDSAFTGSQNLIVIGGEAPRDATYISNFFKCQPALNYGFDRREQPWQQSPDAPGPQGTRAAMIDVMRYWLSHGADGFRVDMADCLIKFDQEGEQHKAATIATWQGILATLKAEFPAAAFVSEWGRPREALKAGFDMDFFLSWRWQGHPNGCAALLRDVDNELERADDHSYFNADSDSSAAAFLDDYLPQYLDTRQQGYWCLITGNHDVPRVAPRLSSDEIALAYGTMLLLPGIPFIYYGDEIGMRYRALPTKEGGYARTGARSPMQWDGSDNLGFSTAQPADLYLPVDPAADAPTVADQNNDPDSLLTFVRQVLRLRADNPAFRPDAELTVVAGGPGQRALVYARRDTASGQTALVAVNPGRDEVRIALSRDQAAALSTVLLERGTVTYSQAEGIISLGGQSFAVLV